MVSWVNIVLFALFFNRVVFYCIFKGFIIPNKVGSVSARWHGGWSTGNMEHCSWVTDPGQSVLSSVPAHSLSPVSCLPRLNPCFLVLWLLSPWHHDCPLRPNGRKRKAHWHMDVDDNHILNVCFSHNGHKVQKWASSWPRHKEDLYFNCTVQFTSS